MNIVLVTRFYPPETGGGGIATYARSLAQGLKAAGHQVRVISARVPQSSRRAVVDGIHVSRIPSVTVPHRCHRLPLVGRYVRFLNDVLYAWRARHELLRLAQEEPPDIVEYADIDAEGIFHPFHVCPAVAKLHTPHFVLRPFYRDREVPYDTRSVGWIEKRAILKVNGVSSPSLNLARIVARQYQLPLSYCEYVPNPIDTDFFSPSPVPAERETVLYVGRLEVRKGADTFAQAVPRIAHSCPEANFVFVGADRCGPSGVSLKADLETSFRNLGLVRRVRFVGHEPPEVFLDYYRQATVVVVPSRYENCPYTLLEAMACAKPVVASRAYGMEEMISDGESGLLFKPGDAPDLAEKVSCLLKNGDLRQRLGTAARRAAIERYSVPVATESTLSFYRSVLSVSGNCDPVYCRRGLRVEISAAQGR